MEEMIPMFAGIIVVILGLFGVALASGSKRKISETSIRERSRAAAVVELTKISAIKAKAADEISEIETINDLPEDDRLQEIADIAGDMFR